MIPGLSSEAFLKDLKKRLILVIESPGDGFNVERFIVTLLNRQGRKPKEIRLDSLNIQQGNPFGCGSQALLRGNGDSAKQAAATSPT